MIKKALFAIFALSIAVFSSASSSASDLQSLTSSSNGKTLTLHLGDEFMINLNSTYWDFQNNFDRNVLMQIGLPKVDLIQPGPNAPKGCQHPGSGCGTVSVRFIAKKKGTTYIQAKRSTCGEAIKCSSANSNYKLKVKVI